MDATEVIPHLGERHRRFQVLDVFAEVIGQAGESPHRHVLGEVLTLDVGRGDARLLRFP